MPFLTTTFQNLTKRIIKIVNGQAAESTLPTANVRVLCVVLVLVRMRKSSSAQQYSSRSAIVS